MAKKPVYCTCFHQNPKGIDIPLDRTTNNFKNALDIMDIEDEHAHIIRDKFVYANKNEWVTEMTDSAEKDNFYHLLVDKRDFPPKVLENLEANLGKCYGYLKGKKNQLSMNILSVKQGGNYSSLQEVMEELMNYEPE